MMTGTIPTRFANRKILVIDDEPRLAESLAALLRGSGYQVAAATSGIAGMDQVCREPYDLVITDLRMDLVDGFEIMRYVAEKCPNTALIVITGHASTESAIEALHQRVADYLPKPFDFDVLRGSIEKVFAQQETDRLRRDLVQMLTHDIKIPLTSILGFAQLMYEKDGRISPSAGQYADKIILNSQRILSMLDNYLTNARAEEGLLEVAPVPILLSDLVEDALRLTALEFRKKSITVRRDVPESLPEIHADEHLLSRAVTNLLNNAAKYTGEGGDVQITARIINDELCIEVSNTGDVMTSDDAAAAFERYRRCGSSRGVDGSGLGLHIVKCVAEVHGGQAACVSRDGVTRFEIAIPVQQISDRA